MNAEIITSEEINVMIANDAVSCVALWTGKALDNLDSLDRQTK